MSSRIHRLLSALQRLALPICTAESCTSGLLASVLTSRPTAPSILLGGVTSYSTLFKHRTLGVSEDILNTEKGGPGDVSEECAEAMARGILRHSGLLEPWDDRVSHVLRVTPTNTNYLDQIFKFGVLLERGQGIGVSTTGYLDKIPEGENPDREGEVYIGCYWVFKGREGTRVQKLDVSEIEGSIDKEEKQDKKDANREARKKHVVDRAIQLVYEVVAELERPENGGKSELDDYDSAQK